jgi:hypothetical protein
MRKADMTRDVHCWLGGGVWSRPEGVVLRGRSEYLKRVTQSRTGKTRTPDVFSADAPTLHANPMERSHSICGAILRRLVKMDSYSSFQFDHNGFRRIRKTVG